MQIKPFKGILYNPDTANLTDVVTPPYDKISPPERAQYAARNPYNMVNVILPKSHSEAGALLQEWLRDGVFLEEQQPAIYVYEQEYEYPHRFADPVRDRSPMATAGISNGADANLSAGAKIRRGFTALLELQPFGKDTIMPHERTFSKVKEDRLRLLGACKMNLGQIFILYSDPPGTVDKLISEGITGHPLIEFRSEGGVVHRMWRITDSRLIKSIQEDMKDKPLFIADGHHRYESAFTYKEKERQGLGDKFRGDEGFNYRMATFVNVDNPDLIILPTHRVLLDAHEIKPTFLLGELEKYFLIEEVNVPAYELLGSWLRSITNSQVPHTMGVYLGGDNYYTLKLKNSAHLEDILGIKRAPEWLYLDVNILHLLILKHIMDIDTCNAREEANVLYLRDPRSAIGWVRNKGARAAFILNPTKIEEVKQIVALGDIMPHKSTDFYPKLYTGLVMRKLD